MSAADFQARGELTFENYKPSGLPFEHFSGTFHVEGGAGRWRIDFFPAETAMSQHSMYDGVDDYNMDRNMIADKNSVQLVPDAAKYYVSSNGVTYVKASTTTIYSGDYPYGASFLERLLWLAFLSGPSFSSANPSIFPAPWGVSYKPESSSFRPNAEWTEQSSNFPGAVTFTASRTLWTNSIRESGLRRPDNHMLLFADGAIGGRYSVITWTNVTRADEHIAFPHEFVLQRYFAEKDGSQGALSESITGIVSSVDLEAIQVPRLELGDAADVVDFRFQSKERPGFYVIYSITNHHWLETNDPAVTKLLAVYEKSYLESRAVPMYPAQMPSNRRRTYTVAICLLVFLSLPVALLVGRSLLAKEQPKL